MVQPEKMTYLQIKVIAEGWCEAAGIDRQGTWHYPFRPDEKMSITQVLWTLHTERNMSAGGMKLYFERYLYAIKATC